MNTTSDRLALRITSFVIAQGILNGINTFDIQTGQKEFAMFLNMAALFAYDGERVIRSLEKADLLMPRELAAVTIDMFAHAVED